jgi:hypothetical protein
MSQEKLKKAIDDMTSAMCVCFEKRLFLPALILLYAGIDAMAWLNLPRHKTKSDRKNFIEWAEKYFLAELKYPCRAIDLYSARCGLLHSYTGESDLTRGGTASVITYAWGTAEPEALQYLINKVRAVSGKPRPEIVLHIDDLFDAFKAATEHFQKDLTKDLTHAKIVYEKVQKYYTGLPPLQFIKDKDKI